MLNINLKEIAGKQADIRIIGRIDTLSAPDFGAAIDKIHSEHPEAVMKLDFSGVEMLTSCGIRELLRFKKAGYSFFLQNVNSDVYFSLKLTGMTMILDVRREIPPLSIEGCELIGKGANAEVYKLNGDTIVKVFTRSPELDDILQERMLAKAAFSGGIPTAISFGMTEVNGRAGLVFELINAKSIAKYIGEDRKNIDRFVGSYTELLREIHAIDGRSWNKYLLADEHEHFMKKLDLLADYLSPECMEKLRQIGSSLAGKHSVLHMDIQPNNVMVTDAGLCLIDMDSVAQGAPEFELANLKRTLLHYWHISDQTRFLSFGKAECEELWNKLIRLYYETEDENFIREKELLCDAIGFTSLCYKEYRDHGASEEAEKIKALLEKACEAIEL